MCETIVNKWYRDLTDAEKGKTLLLGNDIYVFLHSDPKTVIDTQGMTSPITITNKISIVNAETFTLWFKLVATVTSGDSSKWAGLDKELGSVSAGGYSIKVWDPTREIPTSLTDETLNVEIRAYKDAAYTQFYGDDNLDFTFTFFDRSWASAVILDASDFENTYDGWSQSGFVNWAPELECPYTGAYSLRIIGGVGSNSTTIDASGQRVPSKSGYYIQKTFNTSGYSRAFLVIHYTETQYSQGAYPNPAVRCWFNSKDYIARTNQTLNACETWRIVFELDISAALQVRLNFMTHGIGLWTNRQEAHIDAVYVVAFP